MSVPPLRFREDVEARRWLAARVMRRPLVALKIGSPLLMIAAVAVIVRQPNLAAQPLDVLWALALPFAAPFLLAVIYPVVRWMPQEWTLDEHGIHGRGRVRGLCPWSEVAWWTSTTASAGHRLVTFRRAPTSRNFRASMVVRASAWAAVEAWFSRCGPPTPASPSPPRARRGS